MELGLILHVILLTDTGYTGILLQLRGDTLPMCLFFGRITLSGLILMMVHRRFIGSLAVNILSRGTMNRFWSVVDWVPVRL